MADANGAYALVRGEREALWRELYFSDGYHPSPLGSFLQACCVFCAVRGRPPNLDPLTLRAPFSLWGRARFMLPGSEGVSLRMPSAEEMLYFAEVAARATLPSPSPSSSPPPPPPMGPEKERAATAASPES